MKLKSEIPFIRESFNKITNLPEYAERLKANGNYKDFGTRLAWDCIHATIPSEIVCGWYDKYNCNDGHITTAVKSVLREMGGFIMTDYIAQAKQFLADCNATMEIKYLCQTSPKWDSNLHNCYWFTITTTKGSYSSKFYDSLRNTEISHMSLADYARKHYKRNLEYTTFGEKNRWTRELAKLKRAAIPTEYDILACVEKYSYDSFSDFCAEFGFSTDSISARETFLACGEEYAGLRRIFTEEQMEKMRKIQ